MMHLGRLRDLAKSIVLGCYVYLWAPVRNLVRKLRRQCHVVVLVYHRVSDGYRDGVTVGVQQFEEQMEILRRRYEVIDMATFVAGRCLPRRRPAVVITFDDGYADNYLAAKLLRRAGLPCTFFIATRIVGSELGFPHDLERLGRRVPALSWAQIEEMAGWGFRIAPHTAHHANLARLPTDEAIAEITTSREDIVQHLGETGAERCLAYPYGRPEDISRGVRTALRACGIDCCFSAFGGTNQPDFDPYDIRRQGLSCEFSGLAFRAALEGWVVRLPERAKVLQSSTKPPGPMTCPSELDGVERIRPGSSSQRE